MATEVVVAAAAGFDVAALVLVPCSCYVGGWRLRARRSAWRLATSGRGSG